MEVAHRGAAGSSFVQCPLCQRHFHRTVIEKHAAEQCSLSDRDRAIEPLRARQPAAQAARPVGKRRSASQGRGRLKLRRPAAAQPQAAPMDAIDLTSDGEEDMVEKEPVTVPVAQASVDAVVAHPRGDSGAASELAEPAVANGDSPAEVAPAEDDEMAAAEAAWDAAWAEVDAATEEVEPAPGSTECMFVIVGWKFTELCATDGAPPSAGDTLSVEREPDNAKDANALRVLNSGGEPVGHLRAVVAKALSPLIDSDELQLAHCRCECWSDPKRGCVLRARVSGGEAATRRAAAAADGDDDDCPRDQLSQLRYICKVVLERDRALFADAERTTLTKLFPEPEEGAAGGQESALKDGALLVASLLNRVGREGWYRLKHEDDGGWKVGIPWCTYPIAVDRAVDALEDSGQVQIHSLCKSRDQAAAAEEGSAFEDAQELLKLLQNDEVSPSAANGPRSSTVYDHL